jgi:hypothetical protein
VKNGGGLGLQLLRTFRCQDEDRRVAHLVDAAHRVDEAEAVEPRHVDVGDDRVGLQPVENLEPVLAIFCEMCLHSRLDERQAQHVAHRATVIHCQNRDAHRMSPSVRTSGDVPRRRS